VTQLFLYEYAIFKNEKLDKDGDVKEKAEVIVPITLVLARNTEQAKTMAARAIPEENVKDLDRLTVAVRPFG